MEQIEQAVLIALDQTANRELQTQAMQFCEQLKQNKDGWCECLRLFTRDPKAVSEARLFCLQVLDHALTRSTSALSASAADLSLVKNQLGAYIQRELSLQSASRDPPFIRNKLATTFTYLFIETYDTIWPTMVADLITLATETASGSSSPATDFALRVLKAIDEQVVDKAVVRTKEQLTKCNAIKDHLREGDVRTLVGFLRASLSSALPVAVSSDAGEICELSLKLAGAYVSWVDINLIADAEFLTPVFTALQPETPINVRIAACDALVEIIGKGMQPLDKMTLLRMLGATNVIESMLQDTCSSANEMMDGKYEFIEGLARLTNATGKAFAAICPAQVSELQSAAMMEIERLVPLLLRFLSDEYEDTSEIMFEFLNDLLSLFKKMKKLLLSSQGSSNLLLPNSIRQILLSLMDVILQKMKYEDDYSYENENENENEDHVIVFAELRKRLKQFADAISMLDSEVYDQRVSSITRSTMNILLNNSNSSNTSNTSNNSIPNWTHVELAIYITNMYGDVCSRGQRGGINFSDALNDSQSVNVRERNLAQLLVLMIEAISNYLNTPGGSHPAVSLAFFETVVRFGGLFDARPSMIPAILRSFLAGVHHPNKAARIRSWYLLSRFINNVKLQYMAPLTFDVISALADLLIVAAEPPSSNTSPIMSNVSSGQMMTGSFADAAGSQSLFDSHAYLFEVAGLLISSSLIEPSQRLQLMEAVFGPIFNGITNIMNKYDLLSTSDPWVPLQLHHLLTAIGALCKSFPSDTLASTIGSRSSNSDVKHYARSEQETMLIIKATEAVLVVLDRVYRFEPIRFAARYSFSRLLNTLGMAIMPYLRPFITQLLRDCDIAELSDFFNFMTQVAFKFKESAIPHIAELVIPMLNKVFEFLNKSPSGTDEVVQLVNLRKAYLSWLIALFNDDIDTVLLTGINQEHLLTILESMALLCEPASNSALASSKQPSASASNNPLLATFQGIASAQLRPVRPLPGFESFVRDRVVPLLLTIPANTATFNIADGQTQILLGEIAAM
ncbi:Xpo1-domain-containing protein, partial [Ramicandelaber brevisporus]